MENHAKQQLWTAVLDLEADLIAAIRKAARDGAVSTREFTVTYLYYWKGLTFEEISDGMDISVDAARRAHKKMLQALRDTGLLEGYGPED